MPAVTEADREVALSGPIVTKPSHGYPFGSVEGQINMDEESKTIMEYILAHEADEAQFTPMPNKYSFCVLCYIYSQRQATANSSLFAVACRCSLLCTCELCMYTQQAD